VSFRGRLELTRTIGDMLGRLRYLSAGQTVDDRVQASLLAGEIDRLYIEWGLVSVEGLTVDGEPCDADLLLERGPEQLCREISAAIKRECTLSADDRKN
jgi:hypothetical protein